MHKGILAGRLLDARRRIVSAAETAVSQNDLDQQLLDALYAAGREKQPEVRELLELEAIGPIVEALGTSIEALNAALVDAGTLADGYLSESDILAIPGLTKTSQAAITDYFVKLAETAVVEEDTPVEEELASEANETNDAGSD